MELPRDDEARSALFHAHYASPACGRASPTPPGRDSARCATSRRQQEVLVLRYFGEMSETAIAVALGVSAGSVKKHAARGIAALGRALGAGR